LPIMAFRPRPGPSPIADLKKTPGPSDRGFEMRTFDEGKEVR
jgi:hypothetical protein